MAFPSAHKRAPAATIAQYTCDDPTSAMRAGPMVVGFAIRWCATTKSATTAATQTTGEVEKTIMGEKVAVPAFRFKR